jgi:hypothetical protein
MSKATNTESACSSATDTSSTNDTTSVWLTPEIAHFAVSKYFSCSYASQSSPEMLHSAALPCALPHSLVLCCAPLCSAALSHTLPCSLMLCCALSCSATLSYTLLHSLVLCCTLLCSAALSCTLLHSLVLCHTLPHASGPLSHTSPCVPLASPIHLVPLSFLVTTCTLVPGPLVHLVYKPCNYTLLPEKRNPVAFSPCISDLSELRVTLPLYSLPRCTYVRP